MREITRALPKRAGAGGRGAGDRGGANPDTEDDRAGDEPGTDDDPGDRDGVDGDAGVAATTTCPWRIQPTSASPAGEIVATGDCDGSIAPSCCGVPNRPPARRDVASVEHVPADVHCSHAIT